MLLHTMQSIRVLVLSDDPLTRTGLITILSEEALLQFEGQGTLRDLNESFLSVFNPDVVLLVVDGSLSNLQKVIFSLKQQNIPYVVISNLPSDDIGESLTYDRINIIPRDASLAVITAALHAVTVGLSILDRQDREPLYSNAESPHIALTPRESEVLQFIAQGLTNRAIGQVLSIKESTVKFHVNSILSKLNAESRTEAVIFASRYGLITL